VLNTVVFWPNVQAKRGTLKEFSTYKKLLAREFLFPAVSSRTTFLGELQMSTSQGGAILSRSGDSGDQPRCLTDLLDRVIIDQGFSVRKAKKIRKAIFDLWGRALRRGEVVETPLGEMKAVRAPKRRRRINRVNAKPKLVVVNQRERRIKFTPRPELIEVLPTTFYTDRDTALLKELGRKPWATTEDEHQANLEAIAAVIAEYEAEQRAAREQELSRERMSPYEILRRAQRPITDFLTPGRGNR
jgi:hypothetical protein